MRNLIVLPLSLLLCGACGLLPETDDRRIVHSGEVALIQHGATPEVPVALSKSDAYALARAVETGDESAVRQMVEAGKATIVPAHVHVRVTGESNNERRIQVVDGPYAGKVGWVPFEWLRFTRT